MAFEINEYLKSALSEVSGEEIPDAWGSEKANILVGTAMLAQATGDEGYKKTLFELLPDGDNARWTGIGTCYAYDYTREDRYKNKMTALMERLKGELDTVEDEMAYVFYMKYETRLGGKEHYQDVVNRLTAAVSKDEKNVAYCMTALIESLDSVDQMIYEHYHAIMMLFKKCLAEALELEEMSSTEMALIGYSILKGCRMRAILSEKYEKTGMELVDAALEASRSADMDMGACIMAYAEKLLHG